MSTATSPNTSTSITNPSQFDLWPVSHIEVRTCRQTAGSVQGLPDQILPHVGGVERLLPIAVANWLPNMALIEFLVESASAAPA
jgi:hypothetical protein